MKFFMFRRYFLVMIFVIGLGNLAFGQTGTAKPIEGTYTMGDGFVGASYRIEKDLSFEYSTYTDCCEPPRWLEGKGSMDGETLRLKVERAGFGNYDLFDPKQAAAAFRSYRKRKYDPEVDAPERELNLTVVRWGERVYLVEEGAMTDFAAMVSLGLEPRKSRYSNALSFRVYLRSGDEKRAVTGLPELAEEYCQRIKAPVIEARIVSTEPAKDKGVIVIDKGRKNGVIPGMFFAAPEVSIRTMDYFVVVTVGETTAELKMSGFSFAGQKVANVLTTRPVVNQREW